MNKDFLRIAGIAIVLVVALGVAASFYRDAQESERVGQLAVKDIDPNVFVRPHSPSLGEPSAKVTVVEFLDPECESCRVMHPIVKQILKIYRDDIRLVVRYVPLHPNSITAAGALEAAREQGLYWEMLDTLFEHQPVWGSHEAPRPELIPEYAREIGVDMDAYQRFIDDGSFREQVEIDHADAKTLEVRGTPSFFVNRQPLVRLGYAPLKELIEQELAK